MAIFVAIGLTLGAFAGSHLAHMIPDENLKKGFGILLIVIGIKMVFLK